jgi:hypothetical protein
MQEAAVTQFEQHELAGEASRLLKADQDPKALAVLEKLSVMLPDHVDIQTTRAFCLGKLDRFDEAYTLLGHIETLSDSPRIPQTRSFLDARKALVLQETTNPESKKTTRILFPVLDSSGDTNVQLSRKLQLLQSSIEREFSDYRRRDEDTQRGIQHLKKHLQDKEAALQQAYAKNVDLEILLSKLGEEVSDIRGDMLRSGKPKLRILPEAREPGPLIKAEAKIGRLTEIVKEREEALSKMRLKSTDSEKKLSDESEHVASNEAERIEKEAAWSKTEADWRDRESDWDEYEAVWSDKESAWNKQKAAWAKEQDDWKERESTWGEQKDDWERQEALWNDKEVSWQEQKAEWVKKKAVWDEAEASWIEKKAA